MDKRDKKQVTICMLSTGHDPLDDRIYYKETLSLLKRYPKIVLVTPGNSPAFKGENGIKYVPLKNSGSILSRLLVVPKAIYTVTRFKPQVCHFHDYELIFALPFLRLFSRCKIIYDVHEVYPEMIHGSNKVPCLLKPYLAKLVDISEVILSHLADYIVTSDDEVSKRFYNKHRYVTTIFNYPRLALFVPGEIEINQLRNRYKNRTPIIYHGGISEERGLFQMIRAMQILKSDRPDIILLIIGNISNNLLQRTKKEIEKKGIGDHLELIGWVPHKKIVNYISISKVGLIPFLPTKKFMKNIPIKQFEYMACGVPVLGANLPPIASYILKAGCGKVYDSTSVEELASGVIDILQDDTEWKQMSEAGKKAVQDLWNWDRMEDKLFDVYEKLLEI